MPFDDVFPIRLPDTLTITHLLTAGRGSADETMPVIDAVFSKKVQDATEIAEGAHVVVAGETLFLHGCNLPTQATALLEAQNNSFHSRLELDAYGWHTLKSVKLPEQLCEGDYRLTIVGDAGNVRSNTVFITVLPLLAPQYISLFKGLKCLQTANSGDTDHPYLLGVTVDSQGWKTIAHGAYADIHSNMRVGANVTMGGKYDAAGQIQPVADPGQSIFHIGLGNCNNFRRGLLGQRWDIDSYEVLTPEQWGHHKAAELWSNIVTDRAFLGQADLSQP